MPVPIRLVCFSLTLTVAAACVSQTRLVIAVEQGNYSAALRTYQQSDSDRRLLAEFARTLLLLGAADPDPARVRQSFVELTLLGTRARDLLEKLTEAREPKPVQAAALEQLQRLGDRSAGEDLRAFIADPDPELVDRAYSALDPEQDWPKLREALRAPRASRRLAVLQRLGRGPLASDRLQTLSEVGRLDPDPRVRSAAVRLLEPYGTAAWPALELALRDPDTTVSSAALETAARAAPVPALPLLDQQLGAAPGYGSLTAAIALLRMQPPQLASRAQAALVAGLEANDALLRGRSAVLLATLPAPTRPLAAVRAQLQRERVPEMQLALTRLLGVRDPAARSTLDRLALASTPTAAQAATVLAQAGDDPALKRLFALRSSSSALTRITTARALGRDLHQPEAVAQLLADPEPEVRLAAAGAVLYGLDP